MMECLDDDEMNGMMAKVLWQGEADKLLRLDSGGQHQGFSDGYGANNSQNDVVFKWTSPLPPEMMSSLGLDDELMKTLECIAPAQITSKGSVLEIYSPFSSPAPFNNPRSWPDTPSSPMMTKEEENTAFGGNPTPVNELFPEVAPSWDGFQRASSASPLQQSGLMNAQDGLAGAEWESQDDGPSARDNAIARATGMGTLFEPSSFHLNTGQEPPSLPGSHAVRPLLTEEANGAVNENEVIREGSVMVELAASQTSAWVPCWMTNDEEVPAGSFLRYPSPPPEDFKPKAGPARVVQFGSLIEVLSRKRKKSYEADGNTFTLMTGKKGLVYRCSLPKPDGNKCTAEIKVLSMEDKLVMFRNFHVHKRDQY